MPLSRELEAYLVNQRLDRETQNRSTSLNDLLGATATNNVPLASRSDQPSQHALLAEVAALRNQVKELTLQKALGIQHNHPEAQEVSHSQPPSTASLSKW